MCVLHIDIIYYRIKIKNKQASFIPSLLPAIKKKNHSLHRTTGFNTALVSPVHPSIELYHNPLFQNDPSFFKKAISFREVCPIRWLAFFLLL